MGKSEKETNKKGKGGKLNLARVTSFFHVARSLAK